MIAFCWYSGYAPFGSSSLATGDINYTQLDLYEYLRDCLQGKNTFGYSFSMGLGGDTMNVVAYGMSSPMNLLIIFFAQEDFHTYFDVLVICKISLIALTMAYYLQKRFHGQISRILVFLLSLSFAFSQYNITQICNIFWLDAVILLPFVLLGVYSVVREEKPWILAVSVLAAIFCGWYTGIIDCIFAVFWFFFELFLLKSENGGTVTWKGGFRKFIKFALAGGTGALLSAFFFLPVLSAIRKGNRGSLNWDALRSYMRGNFLTVISDYRVGGMSSSAEVSLFAGSLVIIGCIAFFLARNTGWKKKLATGIFLLIVLLTFYWQPLYMLFSMLKVVSSFYCRFSYTGIFTLTFISAMFFSSWENEKDRGMLLAISADIWVFIYLLAGYLAGNVSDWREFSKSILFTLAIGGLLFGIRYFNNKSLRRFISLFLVCAVMLELAYSSRQWLNAYHADDVAEYKDYVTQENQLISELKEYDSGTYRINQSLTRRQNDSWNLTANYNEPFGYAYWGLSTYTNSPDDRQRAMLGRLGYRTNGENYYIVNTSVIATDSLLGVKYFLSPYKINGMEQVEEIPEYNGKYTYENPFCLPLAFLCEGEGDYTPDADNPFLEAEQIYSFLCGEDVDIYIPLEYSEQYSDDNKRADYTISVPDGNYTIYGNLPWESEYSGLVSKDDTPLTKYSCWGSPSVFYIPSEEGEDEIHINVTADAEISVTEPQFYALDLDALQKVTEKLKENEPEITVNGTDIDIDVSTDTEKTLFTSVAYDSGWEIRDNGEVVTPDLCEDCLMMIRLEPGEHHITLRYTVPGIKAGIILSGAGIVICLLWYMIDRRKARKLMK